MTYEIIFLGRKAKGEESIVPYMNHVLEEGADEPEVLRKLLDTYEMAWVESVFECIKH